MSAPSGTPMPTPEYDGGARYVWDVPDWRTLLATAAQRPPASIHDPSSRRPDRGGSWDGGRNFDGTMADALTGWPEGTRRARELSAQLRDVVGGRVERIDWNYDVESSGNLDVARYLEGEPECWMNPDVRLIEGRANRHVHVVFNGAASAGFDAETLTRRGAIAVALVETLEMAGVSTAVTLCWHLGAVIRDDKSMTLRVPLKRHGETLDVDRLAFALAHPGAFRRICFSLMEQMPEKVRSFLHVPGGYGRPSAPIPEGERGDIALDSAYLRTTRTDDEAVAWIVERLEEQGISVKPN